MKHKTISLSKYLTLASLAMALNIQAEAQPYVKSAANTTTFDLQFCNNVTCPTASQMTVSTNPVTLNADMATIEDNGSYSTCVPATFGITSNWGNLWGITFSGVTNSNLTNPSSGFTIGITTRGPVVSLPLPCWFGNGAMMSGPANDPDIAVGTCYNTVTSAYQHFALAVYENNGDIFLEHYAIDLTAGGGITTNPPEPFVCPPAPPHCAIPGNHTPLLLSTNSGGTAARPHIEIWHELGQPAVASNTVATKYAVVWEQDDPNTPGQRQVWGVDGVIDAPGTTSFPSHNGDFAIDDGTQPDVVAINYFDAGGTSLPNDEVAFTTYLTDTGKNVKLSDWDYSTQTVNSTKTLNTAPTQNIDEFQYPRISGPMYTDVVSPSTTDPICVVVVNDNDGNFSPTTDKVTAYKVYDASVTVPFVKEKIDISDYNATDGFSSNGHIGIMPVVTGIGKEVARLASASPVAYSDYPVVFYSDNDHNSSNDGDFFAFGLKMDASVTDPVLYPGAPDEYWEVNYNTLDNGGYFNLTSDIPAIAAATANNTGYDLLTTFYQGVGTTTGEKVVYSFTGTATPYSFKPGKSTGIQEMDANGIAVYPNPVKDKLNITQADGAEYIMMDMAGRSLVVGKISGSKASVNVSNLAAGMYMLQISKDGYTEKVKFVKQ